MILKSPAFKTNQPIPPKFTCNGENVNPPLEIEEVPKEAKSLVLTVTDPDAPGGNWVHWVVWNIKPDTKEIRKNSVPKGAVEGITSFGETGYGGPCPPIGTHAYIFKLYAIDTMLPEDPGVGKKEIKEMISGHVLDKAILRGFYEQAHGENFV